MESSAAFAPLGKRIQAKTPADAQGVGGRMGKRLSYSAASTVKVGTKPRSTMRS